MPRAIEAPSLSAGVPNRRLLLKLEVLLGRCGDRPFAKSVALLAGSSALGRLMLLLASLVLVRQYTVADFGILQIYMSLLMLAAPAASLRYDAAIVLPKDDQTAANLLVLALFLAGLLTLVGSVVVFLSRGLFPSAWQPLLPYLWLLAPGFLGTALYQSLSYWAIRMKSYPQLARTRITQVLWQASAQVVFGFFGLGVLGLVAGDVLGRANGSSSLARSIWRESKHNFLAVRLTRIIEAARSYKDFPRISAASSIMNAAGASIPMLMVASLYGPRVMGWFAIVDKVLTVSVSLVGQAVSQVYMQEAACLAHGDPVQLQALFRGALFKLIPWGAIPALLMLLGGPMLFSWAFGTEWREAGIYARILSLNLFVTFSVWPLMSTLTVLGRLSWQFAWDAGRVVLTTLAIWVSFSTGATPRWAVAAYAAAMVVAYSAHLWLSSLAIKRHTHRAVPAFIEKSS
jgi:O-antigen/teichoic acid export membrane protein